MIRIADRISQPTPAEVKAARKAAQLSQAEATLVVADVRGPREERTWQNYECEVGKKNHRAIPLAAWELFLLMTGQHPRFVLTEKSTAPSVTV